MLSPLGMTPPEAPSIDPFDEAAYLGANPDVRAAVDARQFESGQRHYELFGRAESRALKGPLSRRDKLLGGLDLARMAGVEIGPLAAPIVRKDEGTVLYVDHADTDTLRQKYNDWELDAEQIVPVDMVWGAQSLQNCIGPGRTVDYVVNAHVIEHVPDLVTWLQEIHSILRPDGTLRMAIPDRSFTFDYLRRESTLADALDAYIRQTRVPLPRAILDHFLYETEIDVAKAWQGQLLPADVKPKRSPQFALDVAERYFHSGDYQDVHCWVFTPLSFANLCAELAQLGLLKLACTKIHSTEFMEIEFIAAMQPANDAAECVASWQDGEHLRAQDLASEPQPRVRARPG